ncbi:MAG TPA: rubrerythrin, partial [Leptospiraceae bacterium]|nr:rubrerythrin [Leptospiraceae bacterium]
KKIERNVKAKGQDSLDSIHKAIRAIEDARDFYTKVKEKFADPSVKILFKRLADYNEDNRLVVESQYQFLSQMDKTSYYWEDEELLNSRPA